MTSTHSFSSPGRFEGRLLSRLMQLKYKLLIAGLAAGTAVAYSVSASRRGFLGSAFTASVASTAPVILTANAADEDGFTSTESGLQYKVLKEGTGAIPQPGQTVKAHYTGR